MSVGPCRLCLSYDNSADHGRDECVAFRNIIWGRSTMNHLGERMTRVNKTWFTA